MARFRALHTAVLKQETDIDEFADFMKQVYLPTTHRLPGCVGAELLQGYHGSLPGVAPSRVDYAWITQWESVEANDAAWTNDGVHETPASLKGPLSTLYNYAATVTLIGGFTIEQEL